MKLVGIEWDDDKNILKKKIHRVKKDGRLWVWSGRFSLWSIQNAERIGALYPRE